ARVPGRERGLRVQRLHLPSPRLPLGRSGGIHRSSAESRLGGEGGGRRPGGARGGGGGAPPGGPGPRPGGGGAGRAGGGPRGRRAGLFRVTRDRMRVMYRGTGELLLDDVSPDGRVLVTARSWRQEIEVLQGSSAQESVDHLDWTVLAGSSDDGKIILWGESGL